MASSTSYAEYSGLVGSGGGGGGGVTTLNGLSGAVTLAPGANITLTPSGNTITIASTGGSSGIQSINGDTTSAQLLVAGTSGTDFTISTASGTTTFNLPTASASNRGALSSADWSTFNSKQDAGSYITALTGDATASGPGSAALTLATVNSNVGSFGSASSVGAFTVNAKGLVTAASSAAIQIAESQVTNLVSDLAGKQPVGNYITALTGDVVASGPGSVNSTIQANVVSNGKLAQMPTDTIKGNNTGSTANAADLTVAQVNAILPVFTSTLNGLAPSSGGGTANYLRADGTWDAPPGSTSGTVTSVAFNDASSTPIYAVSGSPVTNSGTLTITLDTQSANAVFAGPTSGGAAQPAFRALVSADIPSLSALYLPLAGGTMSGAINMGSNQINAVSNPTSAQDAATKSYVDAAINGLTWKGPVAAYANSNVPLTGSTPLVIDGYTVLDGDLLLLANQSTAAQDGEYSAAITGGAYVLTANGLPNAVGDAWLVLNGTLYGDSAFLATSAVPTAAFVEFAGPNAYTFSAPLSLSGNTVSISQSTTSTNGYLSSTDWNTFNNKQASGNYITALTGDATASGPGSAALTLATVNSNVGSFGSSTSIPSFTVNAKGLITAASGNVVVAPAGTLSGTTLNSTVVSSSLTSVGTITSGVWNGTTIAIANGGTGQTSANAAFDALSPMTTAGDIIYENSTPTAARLGIGSSGQVLTVSGGLPVWASPATSGTVTSVALADSTGLFNITGSPVTSSGTLTLASFQSQAANTFFAAPDGSSGAPTFRLIVAADVPTLNQNTTGTAANITATNNSTLTTLSALSLPTTQLSGSISAAQMLPLSSGDIYVGNVSNQPAAVAMSGDATIVSSGALTLATVNSNVGSFGSSTSIPSFTVNAKGLITAAGGNVVVAPAGTLSGTTLNSTVVSSSLTSVGTITSGTWNGTTIAVANGGTGDTSFTAYAPVIGGTTATGALQSASSGMSNSGYVLTSTGASSAPTWQAAGGSTLTAPTVQRFTSGSGTYTTPTSPAPLYIKVSIVGGGGGGGAGGSSTAAGTSGGNTTFGTSLLTAAGGGGGDFASAGGAGGGPTVAAGPIIIQSVNGSDGGGAFGGTNQAGASGGSSALGGAGGGAHVSGSNITGIAGKGNSGGGGGGGNAGSGSFSGSGGGAGAYIEVIIESPSSTYAYAVGASGSGGTGANGPGGPGGSGGITVEEYYQ